MESKSNRKKHLIKMSSFMLSGMLVLTLQATDVKAANPVVLVIDPGHGGNDSGAVGTYNGHSYYEKNMTLSIAKELKSQLEATGRFKIYMTRETDTYKSLTYRTDYARQMNADALVSVHINSAGSSARGAEVEIPNTSLYPQLHTEGENIANSILNELGSLGIHRRGAFTRNSANGTTYSDGSTADYYAIVRGAKSNAMTGIIVEHAFISNPNELGQFLSTEDKLKALGRADARGINNYYATHTPVREVRESDYALVYDYNYYINKYSDLKNAFGTNRNAAFNHFLSNGMNEGRQGNATFNVSYYKQNYADLQKAFGNNLKSYYEHYISNGHKEGRVADKLINNTNTGDRNTVPTVNKTVYQGVDYAPVYDADYYYKNNADVQKQFKSTDYAGLLKNFVEKGMAQGQRASENFDVNSYRLQYPDLRAAFGDNLKAYYMHYITNGKREKRKTTGTTQMVGYVTKLNGVDYSSIYDYNYYINKYNDLKQAFGYNDTAALQHFITNGMNEGRQASANFDVTSYRLQYPDLRAAFGDNLKAYYMHYITNGKREKRKTTGTTQLVGSVTKLNGVDYSSVYDYSYYINKYSDLKQAFGYNDTAALQHFITNGMNEGRQASANFDVTSYRLQYPDLRAAFGDNLKSYYMHYITNGKKEGRKTTGTTQMVGYVTKLNGVDYSSVYDYNYYINKYSDLKKAFGYNDTAALQHFISCGMNESRQASSTFILSYYRANYADLRNAFGNNNAAYYLHYITNGKKEGRVANRLLPPTNTNNNSNNNANNNNSSNNNTSTTRPTSPTNNQSNQNTNLPMYEIAGSPKTTEAQMVKYFLSKVEFPDFYSTHDSEVKTINDFVHIYYQEATAEGIRPEVAFAQMCNETGFLRYTGRVKIEQYNFAGLGAIDRDQSSNSFSSVREGIRAQIQHLKAYAVKNPTLKYPLVDGRFKYVTKGSAQYVEWLGTNENPNHYGWATTPGYGYALRKNIEDILATK